MRVDASDNVVTEAAFQHDNDPALSLIIKLNAIDADHPQAWDRVKAILHEHGQDDRRSIIDLICRGAMQRFRRRLVMVVDNAPDIPWDDAPDLDPADIAAEEAALRLATADHYPGHTMAGGVAHLGLDPYVPPPSIAWRPTKPLKDAAGGVWRGFWARLPDRGGVYVRVHRSPRPLNTLGLTAHWVAGIGGVTVRDPASGKPVIFATGALAQANVGAIVRCPGYAQHFLWEPPA
jgi:hypothetical protein